VTTVPPHPEQATSSASQVAAVAHALDQWMVQNDYRSWDPYDGLTSPWLAPVRRVPLLARVCLQGVKRSPWNLRPLLGIRKRLYTKTLSDLVAASCIDPHPAVDVVDRIRQHADALLARRLGGHPGSCWGMDLPYVSRFTSASADTPNLFQTVNAMLALLDAAARIDDTTYRDAAADVVPFLERGLGRLVSDGERIVWRYYPGQDAVVHNVNALVGMALLRLSRAVQDTDIEAMACATLQGVVASQNEDGSWWYAVGPEGRWIDGFHSAYVLEALLEAVHLRDEPSWSTALDRGMQYYKAHLLEPDGLPRYYDTGLYPIDIQNCAQAIQLLARWTCSRDATMWQTAHDAFAATCRVLLVEEADGRRVRFRLQRGRWLSNDLPAIRWGLAPMLLALRWLQRAAERCDPAASSMA